MSTTTILAILASLAIGALVRYGWWRMGQPLRLRNVTSHGLRDFLEVLYYRGFENATLVIEVRHEPALIVRKTVIEDDDVRLYCRCLRLPTTGETAILRELENQGLGQGVEKDWQSSGAVELAFGNDRRLALHTISELLRRLYNVSGIHECVVHLTRIHPGNVRLGFSR